MRLQKDKNYPEFVGVGMGSRPPLPPQPPMSPTATSRRPKCLLNHTQVTSESGSRRLALDGRELKNLINFWFSKCVPQNTLRGRSWMLGGREKGAQSPAPNVLLRPQWLHFYLWGFCV